jgi:hypothetical protein
MATVVFPQADDTATVAAWAAMQAVVNRGAEDPVTVGGDQGPYTSAIQYVATGDRGAQIWQSQLTNWDSTTYVTVFPTVVGNTFAVPAGEQWFTELLFQAYGQDVNASRVRLTAPAGGTWTGYFITSETALSGSNVRCRFFSIANGATLVITTDWRNTVSATSPMSCMIVGTVTGTTTGGSIKVEASHAVSAGGTTTGVGQYGGKLFLNAVRILG